MAENNKDLTKQEVRYLLKRIDRKLKIASTDSEVSGLPNKHLQSLDDLPLTLFGVDDKVNALGAVSVNELIGHIYQQEEKLDIMTY